VRTDECLFCEESLEGCVLSPVMIHTAEGPRQMHIECGLREVLGGIGHLIAHQYWCEQMHDTDAGLTRRQSAKLVYAWLKAVGHSHEEDEYG
jgi:hypothetical protein